jgi:hypothetical protein
LVGFDKNSTSELEVHVEGLDGLGVGVFLAAAEQGDENIVVVVFDKDVTLIDLLVFLEPSPEVLLVEIDESDGF